jgi:hypothetical protein
MQLENYLVRFGKRSFCSLKVANWGFGAISGAQLVNTQQP